MTMMMMMMMIRQAVHSRLCDLARA